MNFKRFSQLWDALVADRPNRAGADPVIDGMSETTARALIEYANGNKSKVEAVRVLLTNPRAG